MAFSITHPVRFHQCDPAGILFFAEVFKIAHDAYEDFIGRMGIKYSQWFQHAKLAVPIKSAAAEYFRPITQGEIITVQVEILKLGRSSFSLETQLLSGSDLCAKVETVHVFIDKKSGKKAAMPEKIKKALGRD